MHTTVSVSGLSTERVPLSGIRRRGVLHCCRELSDHQVEALGQPPNPRTQAVVECLEPRPSDFIPVCSPGSQPGRPATRTGVLRLCEIEKVSKMWSAVGWVDWCGLDQ